MGNPSNDWYFSHLLKYVHDCPAFTDSSSLLFYYEHATLSAASHAYLPCIRKPSAPHMSNDTLCLVAKRGSCTLKRNHFSQKLCQCVLKTTWYTWRAMAINRGISSGWLSLRSSTPSWIQSYLYCERATFFHVSFHVCKWKFKIFNYLVKRSARSDFNKYTYDLCNEGSMHHESGNTREFFAISKRLEPKSNPMPTAIDHDETEIVGPVEILSTFEDVVAHQQHGVRLSVIDLVRDHLMPKAPTLISSYFVRSSDIVRVINAKRRCPTISGQYTNFYSLIHLLQHILSKRPRSGSTSPIYLFNGKARASLSFIKRKPRERYQIGRTFVLLTIMLIFIVNALEVSLTPSCILTQCNL
jgi:hypothetical protein